MEIKTNIDLKENLNELKNQIEEEISRIIMEFQGKTGFGITGFKIVGPHAFDVRKIEIELKF